MRAITILVLASLWWLIPLEVDAAGSVRVRGYTRKDGTYVAPHYRSKPDGNFYNNWSTKGNINPYTGKEGTRVTPPASYRYAPVMPSTAATPTIVPSTYPTAAGARSSNSGASSVLSSTARPVNVDELMRLREENKQLRMENARLQALVRNQIRPTEAPRTAHFDDERVATLLSESKFISAAQELRAAAEKGDARAKGMLGMMYEKGLGLGKDLVEACKWYTRAVDAGDNEFLRDKSRLESILNPEDLARARAKAYEEDHNWPPEWRGKK